MKILFYSPVRLKNGGGCERWHCDIANSFSKQFGDQVRILTANLGDDKWSTAYLKKQLKSISYEQLNFPILSGILIPTPAVIKKLYIEMKASDVVHFIYGFAGQDILMALLKLFTGTKVVVGHHAPTFHTNPIHNLYMRYFSRWLLNLFSGHQTLNSRDKEFLVNKWHVKNVHFIPSGIRVEKFTHISKISHSTLNFISVGRYELQKGYDLLLDAINQFNIKYPHNKAIFQFVGGGLLKEKIQQAVKVHPNVQDLGYIQYEKLPAIYANSDVYLLPSREEPFGLVLIEAWAAGIPVLATHTEGPNDMLNPRTGLFIPKITVASILFSIEKVYNLWQTNSFKSKFATSYLRNYAKLFSIDVTAQRMKNKLFVK